MSTEIPGAMGNNYRKPRFIVLSFVSLIWVICSAHSQTTNSTGGDSKTVLKCDSKSPLNLSNDICGDLCHKDAICSKDSGACVCEREPTPTSLGGHFTHCTNWDYVEQAECKEMCASEGKNDSRVCWTFTVGNYCTCFDR